MEDLDVRLTRSGEESWGFRLIGGVDFNMPLTVVKVVSNSPADIGGLRNGDTVSSISGVDASAMSHDDSRRALAAAGDRLELGVVRGLYDPVLDDFEPLYEIDQPDSDQQLQPTEVPSDCLDIGINLPEFDGKPKTHSPELLKPIPDILNSQGDGDQKDLRSLTASPFVLPTKPYRPFSTEPLSEIPPLEAPIILNPNYQDEFGRLKSEDDFLPATKFKLPISEQYDPDGRKQKTKTKEGTIKDVSTNEFVSTEEVRKVKEVTMKTDFEQKDQVITKQEVKFMEDMKKEIDLEKIEMTATSIVDESIEKAVTVAEEIKKEIAVELSESSVSEVTDLLSVKSSSAAVESSVITSEVTTQEKLSEVKSEKIAAQEVEELVELIDKTTDEIVKKSSHKEVSATHVDEVESVSISENASIERQVSKDKTKISETAKTKSIQKGQNVEFLQESTVDQKDVTRKVSAEESTASVEKRDFQESKTKTQSQTVTGDTKTETKYSTAKLLAEQRAYTIGLQTIPNIRGTVHSSYHYDLLLRTFFIHLTDVMVALSRFILAEPILSKPPEQREVMTESTEKQEIKKDIVTETKEAVTVEKEKLVAKRDDVKAVATKEDVAKTEMKHEKVTEAVVVRKDKERERKVHKADDIQVQQEQVIRDKTYEAEINYIDEKTRVEELESKRQLSGSKMAQLTEKRSEQLMQNMEALITEFESKSAGEDIELVRERRSRSRSRVDTPIDTYMLDKRSQEVAEFTSDTTTMSTSMTETMKKEKSESRYESTDYEEGKSRAGKNTYIAIVESHVYTNKDAILEEHLDISETASVQSVEEAKEIIEAVLADKVSVDGSKTTVEDIISTESITAKKEKKVQVAEQRSKAIVEQVKEVQKVEEKVQTELITAKKEEKVQVAEQKSKAIVEEVKEVQKVEEKAQTESITAKKEEKVQAAVQRSKAIVEEIKEVQKVEKKAQTESIKAKKEEKVEVAEQRSKAIVEAVKEVQKVEEKAKTGLCRQVRRPVMKIRETETSITQDQKVVQKDEEKSQTVMFKQVRRPVMKIQETKVSIVQNQEVQKVEEKAQTSMFKQVRRPVMKIQETKTSVAQDHEEVKKVVEKSQKVMVKQVRRPVMKIQEVKTSIVQDHKVTEVKDKVEIAQAEIVSEKKEKLLVSKEETLALKEESVHIKEEAVPLKEKLKEEVQTFEKEIAVKNRSLIEDKRVQKEDIVAVKEQVAEVIEQEKSTVHIDEQTDISVKTVEVKELLSQSKLETHETKQIQQESTFVAKTDQESSFVAKLDQESTFVSKSLGAKAQKLTLDLAQQKIERQVSSESDIDTPTPSTVPPTPLTDEYMFSLVAKLPKREGPPVPRDCSPSDEDEDPHIVKKGLVPNYEANVEEGRIFDPPLPTPPTSPKSPKSPTSPKSPSSPRSPQSPRSPTSRTPVYCKPGLRGGADREYTKEEILEIERKSSLLASAIDQTIKSIEEYKEEVGIKKVSEAESSQNGGVMYNGYAKVVETKIYDTAIQEVKTSKQSNAVEVNDVQIQELSNDVSESKVEETKTNLTNKSEEPSTVPQNVEITEQKTVSFDDKVEKIESKTEQIVSNGIVTEPPTIANVENGNQIEIREVEEEKRDPMEGYKPVHFDLEELNAQREKRAAIGIRIPQLSASQERELYKTAKGELIGTHQGIVDGLDQAVVDAEIAKELGKPGITEEKIAALISGEAEMLREAHVMGLSRVLASHMSRADDDDSSVDFKRIKPIVESLRDSEVLKALNEELIRTAEERKKEERKWTTFLQKPKRPVPRSKFGYYKEEEEEVQAEPYKVKIVKQPKPKVAPDYKPKDFNTGLLPWEERALREPTPPPVAPEDPILVPEDPPEVLEAVDPLPESEVPDLEDSGIPLPPPPEPKEATPPPEENPAEEELEEIDLEAIVEETQKIVEGNLAEEMERTNLAEQLMMNVQNMVDPNAPLEQQLAQMRAQLAALAQLPGVIQQSLELVTRQLTQLSNMESSQISQPTQMAAEDVSQSETTPAAVEEAEGAQTNPPSIEEVKEQPQSEEPRVEEPTTPTITPEDLEKMKKEEQMMLEEQRRVEKQKKELLEAARLEHESRQVKQHPTPRVGKPKPVFGPATPQERPLVLPGGRKWRKPKDAYNEAFIAETLAAQAEIISGKAKGLSYESVRLPYDERINFMKYEKPPVSLDHLKDSDVYKMIHDLEKTPLKRVEMLTPVMAEEDYREKCRSMTPCPERLAQQVQP